MDDSPPRSDTPSGLPKWCGTLLRTKPFQAASVLVILLNAAVLGALTFSGAVESVGPMLIWIDHACLAFFTFEVIVGLVSFGLKPWRYFKRGWNVFDFVIVAASFLPGLRENVTIFRLLRLARVARLFNRLPSLRIIMVAMGKALPKSAGVFALTGVVMYLWAMIGWIAFGEDDAEHFESVGTTLLVLLQMLTFDDLGETIRDAMAANMWTLPYFVLFVLFAAFVLMNFLIGVVLASMEEAQRLDDADGIVSADTAVVLERLERIQSTVDELKAGRGYSPFAELPETTAQQPPAPPAMN